MGGTRESRAYIALKGALLAVATRRARALRVVDPDPYEGGVFTVKRDGNHLLLIAPTGEVMERTKYIEPILFFFSPLLTTEGGVTLELEA